MHSWTFVVTFGKRQVIGTVTAETAQIAKLWVEKEFKSIGIHDSIELRQLVPMVTTTRHVRILSDQDFSR